jgi:hypothetical protein
MFSPHDQATASLLDLTSDLNQQFHVDLSKEALHKRFTPQAVSFMKTLVKEQLSKQLGACIEGLQGHFRAIHIKDSTKFSLPSDLGGCYPGFGNFSEQNGLMCLQYEYDLQGGVWESFDLCNIKTNDQKNSNQTINQLEAESLYIRDLGYITPIYLKAIAAKGAYFLNRLPPQANIYTLDQERLDWKTIHGKFNKVSCKYIERQVLLYAGHHIPCRIVIERVSDQEYQKRLKHAQNSAKSRGVGVSSNHKIRCRYNVFITNVDAEKLPATQIRRIYYLRWQIELVFKTWKSFFRIHKVKNVKKERLECQLWAKMLWILLNWQFFKTTNHYINKISPGQGVSVLKFFKRCAQFSHSLRAVVLNPKKIFNWLKDIFLPLIENTLCEAPTKKQTHYQVLAQFNNTLS